MEDETDDVDCDDGNNDSGLERYLSCSLRYSPYLFGIDSGGAMQWIPPACLFQFSYPKAYL